MYKISLSLLVAMAFMLPTASVMGATANGQASSVGNTPTSVTTLPDTQTLKNGLNPQAPCIITAQGVLDPIYGPIVGNIPTGTYNLIGQFYMDPSCGPATLKAFLEIDQKSIGTQVTMYQTSFEDNFDIYNNWVQIDGDCGLIGGYYDSWAWSSARSSDGSHSFKNTMYDVYKGNQDDFLQCKKSFDVSTQSAINISFDIWVKGSYTTLWAAGWMDPDGVVRGQNMWTVYDYLDFEVSDNVYSAAGTWFNPDNYFNGLAMANDNMVFAGSQEDNFLEGAYKFADTSIAIFHSSPFENYVPKAVSIGNGWWHVWWQRSVADLAAWGLNTKDIMFRFSWHADPEVQFEGAYVDNVKVVSIENTEAKVWQGHTQGPVTFDPGSKMNCTFYVPFDLPWNAVNVGADKTTTYDFKLWLEVLDANHVTANDWPDWVPIVVNVGNFYEAQVSNVAVTTTYGGTPVLPGTGLVDEGQNLHITADVHLQGTVPATNVPVVFTANKLTPTTAYFTDFESGVSDWQFGDFNTLAPEWHVTNYDKWSGSSALGCFDENTKYYQNAMYYDYALQGTTFDISSYLTLKADFYAKWLTEGSADTWGYLLFDAAGNTLMANRGGSYPYIVPYSTFGYQPTWIGPTQPASKYASIDIIALWHYWHDIRGLFRNTDGSTSYKLATGFVMYSTSTYINYNVIAANHNIYWSGVYIDDYSVTGTAIGTEMYKQVVTIPKMEPCVTYHVQFNWNEVPYCNYLLTVSCNPAGSCNNYGYQPWTGQILVTSQKQMMNAKEVTTQDLTGWGGGAWTISSSDTNNYLATQSGVLYAASVDEVAMLAPNNGGNCGTAAGDAACLNIAPQIAAGLPVKLSFDAWYDIEAGWDFLLVQYAKTCPADKSTDWTTIMTITGNSYTLPEVNDPNDGWLHIGPINLVPLANAAGQIAIRFRFISDTGSNYRGAKLDNIIVTNLLSSGFPPVYKDFVDPMNDLGNWCLANMHTGSYWFESLTAGTWYNFNDVNANKVLDPTETTVPNMNDCLIWHTTITDCVEAFLAFETDYKLRLDGVYPAYSSHGYVEISKAGANNWVQLYDFTGTTGGVYVTKQIPITFLAGQPIDLRFRLFTAANTSVLLDHWYVRNVHITGKQDSQPPITTMTMSGTMKDSGWYSTPVQVKITGVDQGIAGMKEIHYKLDGVEKVVAGSTASFTVSANGKHTLEYWGVDNVGNVEVHHIAPDFKIDSGAAPSVSITAPTPGIYLFGKKIMSSSSITIIGPFTVDVTAADSGSGVYRVTFYLDGNVIGEDTTAPYSMYISQKHSGAATIKVTAEDFAQNAASATLSLKYFKFF